MSLIFRSLITAAVTLSTLSTATVVKRNDGPTAPPCSVSYTPYLYAGCYSDLGSPRALVFSPVGLNRQNMTVETCTAVCKGRSADLGMKNLADNIKGTISDMQELSITGNAIVAIPFEDQ